MKGRRGDGWSTFTGNRDAARGTDDDDADDANADDRYDGYDRYDDDDDERVFRERRDAAEFLARIRAASASDDRADDCEPIESVGQSATNKPTGVNKPRRGGRGRASNDDAGPAAPATAPVASTDQTAGRSGDASGPSWLSARVRGIGKTPMHQEDPPPKPATNRGAGTSRRSAEAAASRAARGALSLFLSGALEEGLRRGGGASNVDAAAAETAAERRTTPRTWNPAETADMVNISISPADDDDDVNTTPNTPVPVDRRRGLLDIQLAQERETAAEQEKARGNGFAAAASRSVPAYGRNGRNDPHAPSVSFSLGALIGAGPRSGYGGRGSAFVKSPQSPQSPVTSIPAAWGGVRSSSSIESSRSRGDASSHGSPPPPSLLDIQREEEARRTSRGEFATVSASPPYQNAFGSPSPNFRQTFGGSSPASARSWYVPDSGRGVAVGLRALLAEEEDARLAAELAAAEAERAKVKVPRLDEEENAEKPKSRRSRAAKPGGRNQRRPTDGSKGGTKGDGEDEAGDDGEDEAGRRLRRAAAKKKAKASSSVESSAAGTGAVNGRRRGRVGGERSVGARMSGPAKAGPSPAGDATGNGTKPRESEPPQRGNGRGGRSRRRAPQQP